MPLTGGWHIATCHQRQNKGEIIAMKRRTTTQKINSAITNNLLIPIKAECYNKTTCQIETINSGTLAENLQSLCESGVLASCIGWHYERDYKTNGYIAECSRMDGCAENIVTVRLRTGDGVDAEDIERALKIEETEE